MFRRVVCISLLAGAQLCAQGWKHWPCKVIWTQPASGKVEDRDIASISWNAPGLGSVRLTPGAGLEPDEPVVLVRAAGKTVRVPTLEESDSALKRVTGGLEWPQAFNMLEEPNKPELEKMERGGWALFRLSWATNYQGYTPNGLLVLAWNRTSGRWRTLGCLGDEIRLKAVDASGVRLEAKGVVRTGAHNEYMDWNQEILLKEDVFGQAGYELGSLHLSPIK